MIFFLINNIFKPEFSQVKSELLKYRYSKLYLLLTKNKNL